MNARDERRQLKQQLFKIRLFIEGDGKPIGKELKALKKKYESNPKFTSWSDFPEKWDIGDPNGVKSVYLQDMSPSVTDSDRRNYRKIQNKSYDDIVYLEHKGKDEGTN